MVMTVQFGGLPAPASDLRRRRTRELAEVLVRSRWALPDDRALIEAIYRDNLTAAHIASLRDESPRAVRRRVRAVAAQLLSPRFTVVLHERERWPARRRRVATACVLQGRTLREAARHLNLTLHTVRTEMAVINAVCDAHTPRGVATLDRNDEAHAARLAPGV